MHFTKYSRYELSFLWSLFIMTKRCGFLYVFVYLFIGTFRNHCSLSHLVSLLCSRSNICMHSYTHLYKTTIYSYTYINIYMYNSPIKKNTFPVKVKFTYQVTQNIPSVYKINTFNIVLILTVLITIFYYIISVSSREF